MRSPLLVPTLVLVGALPLAGADVALDWNHNTEPDLASYRVYRAASTPVAIGPGTRIASDLQASAYVDAARPVGTWYYVVTAVDATGNESVASSTAVAVVSDEGGGGGGTLAGLQAEFFDFTGTLALIPDLTARTPDVVRTDATIAYAATSAAWTGLDSRFIDTFASRHTGYLVVPTAGSYTLSLSSDDGSRLTLDGTKRIDNDGQHGMRERSVTLTLAAGLHPLRVEFFENTGSAGLRLSWAGPGIAKQVVPASALVHDAPTLPAPAGNG